MSWATGPGGKGAAVLKLVSTLGADRVFDPETIQILVAAFDEAWKAVQASGAPFGSERYVELARQILGKSIIDDATHGDRDQHELTQSALLKLAQSNLIGKPHIDPRNNSN
jgi:hypothetical protein